MVLINLAVKTKKNFGLNMLLKTIFLVNNVNNVNAIRCQCSPGKEESWTQSG